MNKLYFFLVTSANKNNFMMIRSDDEIEVLPKVYELLSLQKKTNHCIMSLGSVLTEVLLKDLNISLSEPITIIAPPEEKAHPTLENLADLLREKGYEIKAPNSSL